MGRTMSSGLWEKVLETSVKRLALLETPSGFALFNIEHEVFAYPQTIWAWLTDIRKARYLAHVLAFVKVADKSVTQSDEGPGEELSRLIKKYYRSGRELYVEDEKLRHVICLNLNVKCSDDNYVVHEVMWGLRNIVYDILFEDRDNITCRFHLTTCEGLKACISDFKLSPEAITKEFIIHAAGLYRCCATYRKTAKDMREACDSHVPGIGPLIKDDMLYADVMAKILTPGLEPDWDFTEKFPEDTTLVLKLKEIEAKAEAAREEVGYQMYQFMHATFLNLRDLPGIIEKAADSLRGHHEMTNLPDFAESSCGVVSNQNTYDDIEGASKRSRIDELNCELQDTSNDTEGASKRSSVVYSFVGKVYRRRNKAAAESGLSLVPVFQHVSKEFK